jgi:hypothetical protein
MESAKTSTSQGRIKIQAISQDHIVYNKYYKQSPEIDSMITTIDKSTDATQVRLEKRSTDLISTQNPKSVPKVRSTRRNHGSKSKTRPRGHIEHLRWSPRALQHHRRDDLDRQAAQIRPNTTLSIGREEDTGKAMHSVLNLICHSNGQNTDKAVYTLLALD